jgi:hypothetical protein
MLFLGNTSKLEKSGSSWNKKIEEFLKDERPAD